MQNPEVRETSSHLSIRMSYGLRKELEREVERQGSTMNALVNHVLQRYITFDRMADYDHSVTLERACFEQLIEKVNSEDLVDIAKKLGPKIVKRDFAFFNVSPTTNNVVSKYFEPVGAYSDRFDINVAGEFPNLKLILTHDYGRKWSDFLEEYCRGVIESITKVKPLIKVEDDLVTIEFGSGALP